MKIATVQYEVYSYKADDVIQMYVDRIKDYYFSKDMDNYGVDFDSRLLPALEKIALELI